LLNGLGSETTPEGVARETARRPAEQDRMRQPALQQCLDTASLHRVLASVIERFSPSRQLAHERIEQDVAGSRLKPHYVVQSSRRRKKDNACQSSQVQQ
jgi:hypothetical protein